MLPGLLFLKPRDITDKFEKISRAAGVGLFYSLIAV
jgi:hypothetical protein